MQESVSETCRDLLLLTEQNPCSRVVQWYRVSIPQSNLEIPNLELFISFRENFLSTNLGERKIRIILAGILEVELGRESGGASLWLWNFQQSGNLNDSVVRLVYQKR